MTFQTIIHILTLEHIQYLFFLSQIQNFTMDLNGHDAFGSEHYLTMLITIKPNDDPP